MRTTAVLLHGFVTDATNTYIATLSLHDALPILLREKGLPTDDFDSFVFLKGNKVYLKSTGALHVLKDLGGAWRVLYAFIIIPRRSEEHTSELQSRENIVCRLLLEKKILLHSSTK